MSFNQHADETAVLIGAPPPPIAGATLGVQNFIAGGQANTATSFTLSNYIPPAAGANKILIVGVTGRATRLFSATFGGVSMGSAAVSWDWSSSSLYSSIFTYTLGSSTTAGDIVINYTNDGTGRIHVGACTAVEVVQQAPEATDGESGDPTAGAGTLIGEYTTITNGALVIDLINQIKGAEAAVPLTALDGQTVLNSSVLTGLSEFRFAMSYKIIPTAGTGSYDWGTDYQSRRRVRSCIALEAV